MKEWACVEIKHHKDVGKTIEGFINGLWLQGVNILSMKKAKLLLTPAYILV